MSAPRGPVRPAAGVGPTRLSRLLAMVPYLLAHPGISVAEAAVDLQISRQQLVADLNQLWMCGLPGYTPGDLIDLDFETGDSITVIFSAGMDRPLRLTHSEASVLLVALRSLIDMRGVLDPGAARRAIAKIEAAVGETGVAGIGTASGGAGSPTSDPAAASGHDVEGEPPAVRTVRDAVRDGRAVWIRYYSASRDAVSERVVDPIRLQVIDGNTYLEGWCRTSDGIRLFRLDRVDEARTLDEAAQAHQEPAADAATALFGADPHLPTVEIDIDRSAEWVIDYYLIEPLDDPTGLGDGEAIRARITYGSEEWLVRFVAGFGGRIRVRDAPDIDRAVTDGARAALAGYEFDASPSAVSRASTSADGT